MHGRVKVKSTAQQQAEKEKERAAKLLLYNTAMEQALQKREHKTCDDEALSITSNLLLANPDIYTMWNFRKEILLFLKKEGVKDYQSAMNDELSFTETCLRVNPKSYGSWQHRIWALEEMPEPDWNKELKLCNKYLEYDERNFHCWYYRYLIAGRANIHPEKELEFMDEKINVNFSNYSSWHYRSKLLPRLFPDTEGLRPIEESRLLQEFDLVQNAAFTDPNDQSAWFYHRWLLGRGDIRLQLNLLYLSKKNCVIAVFNKSIEQDIVNATSITVNGSISEIRWSILGGSWGCSPAWVGEVLNFDFSTADGDFDVEASISNDGRLLKLACTLSADRDECWVGRETRWKDFSIELSVAASSVLQQELESCLQLLELEPDSKWPLLTSMLLMRSLNFTKFKCQIMDNFERLIMFDPKRKGYYIDLRSKFHIENVIEQTPIQQLELNLSGLELSTFYHPEYFVHLRMLDISNNCLKTMTAVSFLRCLETLNINNNEIDSCEGIETLKDLQQLFIQGNKINTFESILPLTHCNSLKELDLLGNPISNHINYKEMVLRILPTVHLIGI